jgi:transglycosylase-like protein with SLT domain
VTPEELNSPDKIKPEDRDTRRDGWHRWERAVPRTANWLRAAFVGDTADRHHRVPPKTRSLQLGVAVAAIGVIGVCTGASGAATEQASVQTAAHVTPLAEITPQAAAPLAEISPQPAQPAPAPQAPAPAPAEQPAPEAAPAAPAAEPEQAAEPVEEKPKDQIGAWINEATEALVANGVSRDLIDADAIRMIIMHESNGNPNATNNWDSNASAGTPSIGLMQTIEPTFESYKLPGHDDIYNPVDNIIAATRYAISTYGSTADVPGVVGVRAGGSYRGY